MSKTYIVRPAEVDEAREAEMDRLLHENDRYREDARNMAEQRELDNLNRRTKSRRDVADGVAVAMALRNREEERQIRARQKIILEVALWLCVLAVVAILFVSQIVTYEFALSAGGSTALCASFRIGTLWPFAWPRNKY